MKPPRLTPQERACVRALYAQKLPLRDIAREVNRHIDSVRRVVDPAYAERRTLQIARNKLAAPGDPKVDLRALRAAIPDDRRSLTGKIFGDPLPGRSALDRRVGA